jgi:hypothetical protein
MCTYSEKRGELLLSYLYDDISDGDRAAFESHLPACADCTRELAELGAVRAQLARWTPPEPKVLLASAPAFAARRWWQDVPAWAQVAAAVFVLGTVAALANLDVHYGSDGLVVRTGLIPPASVDAVRPAGPARAPVAPDTSIQPASAPEAWRGELAALEQRLRSEMRGSDAFGPAETGSSARPVAFTTDDSALLRRVQTLLQESERRQQRELALRIADVLRDVNAQRQADLVRIDRSIGALERNTGVEVMRQGQMLNYLVRTAQTR